MFSNKISPNDSFTYSGNPVCHCATNDCGLAICDAVQPKQFITAPSSSFSFKVYQDSEIIVQMAAGKASYPACPFTPEMGNLYYSHRKRLPSPNDR